MLTTIKICFSLYSDNLKIIVKDNTMFDVETMTIDEIDAAVDILHMKYILTSLYSVSLTSIQYMAYAHMKTIIEKYNNNTCRFLGNDMANIESTQFTSEVDEHTINECEPAQEVVLKKGWIF